MMFHNVTYVQPQEFHNIRLCVTFQRATAREILKQTQKVFDITEPLLLGQRRDRGLVTARWAAMYVMYKITELSYPQMARVLKKDHTTVMYGVAQAIRILSGELGGKYDGEGFSEKVNQILARFRA